MNAVRHRRQVRIHPRRLSACICSYFLLAVLLTASCGHGGEKVTVLIPEGLSTHAIAETLKQHQAIDNPEKFRVLARLFRYDRKLRQGRYEFGRNSEELLVLRQMTRPGSGSVKVTIPEGFTMKQIADVLEENGVCRASDFLAACRDKTLLDSLRIPLGSAEGYLFPDTYDLELSSDPQEIVTRMVRHFFAVYDELEQGMNRPGRRERQGSEPESSRVHPSSAAGPRAHLIRSSAVSRSVILASIVEREAVKPEEAPIIAGVFRNRLNRGMALQSCATVEYILPVHKERLTAEDTRIESPYNTYLHPGLPPGPICNPGRTALAAALRPETTEYLYFLSRGDGSHIFSKTWHEHESARRRLRRNKTED